MGGMRKLQQGCFPSFPLCWYTKELEFSQTMRYVPGHAARTVFLTGFRARLCGDKMSSTQKSSVPLCWQISSSSRRVPSLVTLASFFQFSRHDFDDVDVLVCGKLYNFSNNEFGFFVLGLLWISLINWWTGVMHFAQKRQINSLLRIYWLRIPV